MCSESSARVRGLRRSSLATALLGKGLGAGEIDQVLGGNFIRVFEAVEQVAAG